MVSFILFLKQEVRINHPRGYLFIRFFFCLIFIVIQIRARDTVIEKGYLIYTHENGCMNGPRCPTEICRVQNSCTSMVTYGMTGHVKRQLQTSSTSQFTSVQWDMSICPQQTRSMSMVCRCALFNGYVDMGWIGLQKDVVVENEQLSCIRLFLCFKIVIVIVQFLLFFFTN